jgi:hypothetical protein
MRLLFLSLLLIPTFYFSTSSAKQIWLGASGNPTYPGRCAHLAGNYITSGRYPNFIYTPQGHPPAIDSACQEMNSEGGIRCLLQIRETETDDGLAPKFHWGNTGKGARRHYELSGDVVRACARMHT